MTYRCKINKVALEDVAKINPRLDLPLRPDDTVSFVSMSGISAETGSVIDEEVRKYAAVSKGYTPFVHGDLLVAKITPCFENGKIAQASLKHRVGFGSTEFHVVRPNIDILDRRYAFHFLRQAGVRRAGERRMTGSAGQRRVPQDFLAKLEIPLPSIEEQRRLSTQLDCVEALRAKRRQGLAKLDSLTQSLFLDMFGDPVTNPKMWQVKKLGQVGYLDRGISKHRPRNAQQLLNGPYPFIQTGDVANCRRNIKRFHSTYSELGLQQSKLWPAGTLCITIAANIAKTGVLTFDACFPDSIVGFVPREMVLNDYIQTWLSFLQSSIEKTAPESAQKNINLEILRNLPLPVPPIELQNEFKLRLAMTEKVEESNQKFQNKIDSLFTTLQHRAFSGEL